MYDNAEKGLRLAEQGDLGADAIKLLEVNSGKTSGKRGANWRNN